ncbi:HNH endonuclease family protein [Lentzea sp. NPDC005914]|uniref:HNH endonuclease family protein n=1 Tax=Lentzea sp. NPDC005914 TaxID=3154572 RepID=UPI0033D22025
MSKVNRTIGVLVAAAALTFGFVSPALATPTGIPTTAEAKSKLAALTVRADGPMTGYSRDKFPHWITKPGTTCNTREEVLKRDGTNVVTDSSCAATSGRWYSPYDGATLTAASDLDIDHIVPLAAAWRSGAASWTTAQRQAFANDMTHPQLIAVTDNVNQAKGDQTPATWKPPLTSYWCTYAKMWVGTKSYYGLSVNSAEKTELTGMLGRC